MRWEVGAGVDRVWEEKDETGERERAGRTPYIRRTLTLDCQGLGERRCSSYLSSHASLTRLNDNMRETYQIFANIRSDFSRWSRNQNSPDAFSECSYLNVHSFALGFTLYNMIGFVYLCHHSYYLG